MSPKEKLEAMRSVGSSPKILRVMRDLTSAQQKADEANRLVHDLQFRLGRLIEGQVPKKQPKEKKPVAFTPQGWVRSNRHLSTGIPARHCAPYNAKENKDLLAEWADGNGLTIGQICHLHQRGMNGIQSQLRRLEAKNLPDWSVGEF